MNGDFSKPVVVEKFREMLNLKEIWYFDVDEFCEIVDDCLAKNDLTLIPSAFKLAFEQHPESTGLQLKKLEYHLAMVDLDKAKTIINLIYERELYNPDFLIALGKFYSLCGRWLQSIKVLQKALGFCHETSYINKLIGNEYFQNRRYGFALSYYKKSLAESCQDENLMQAIVDCYIQLERNQSCIAFLKKYIDNNPYSYKAWYELGLVLKSQADYNQAIEAFEYANLILPDDANSMYMIAECYEELEDWENALLCYKNLSEKEEQSAFANFKIGDCYSKNQLYEKAIVHYKIATYLDPHLDKAWYAKSLNYEKLNKFLESKHSINRALEYQENNLDYLKQSAYIHIELGEYEEAEQRFMTITHQDPKDLTGWFARSEILIILGEYRIALEVLNQATKTIGPNEKIFYQKSYCYFLLGEKEEALFALEKSLKINPQILILVENQFPHLKKRNKFIKNLF